MPVLLQARDDVFQLAIISATLCIPQIHSQLRSTTVPTYALALLVHFCNCVTWQHLSDQPRIWSGKKKRWHVLDSQKVSAATPRAPWISNTAAHDRLAVHSPVAWVWLVRGVFRSFTPWPCGPNFLDLFMSNGTWLASSTYPFTCTCHYGWASLPHTLTIVHCMAFLECRTLLSSCKTA